MAINCDYALRTGFFQLGVLNTSSSHASKGEKKIIDTNNKSSNSYKNDINDGSLLNIALEKYKAVIGNGTEVLVSCSDDFTMFMWKPQESKTPVTRMVGHQQIVNHIAFSPGVFPYYHYVVF